MTVYNTRNRSNFYSRSVRTVLHGAESLSHLGPKILELLPNDMKNLSTLTALKKALNSGSHMLVHVSFVEPTSIRFVSFNLWMQNQLFLHSFLVLSIYNIYVCVCVCICIYEGVCMYIYVCVCVYMHVRVYACVYIYIYIYIYIYLYICIYIYIVVICIYIYIYIYIYVICIYIYIYIYMCMYI